MGGGGCVGDWEGVSDGGRGLKLKISKFCNFTQKEHLPAQKPKFIFKKQKIVLNMRILIFCWATLQLVQIFKPIRNLFCTTGSCSDLGIYLVYKIYKFHQI